MTITAALLVFLFVLPAAYADDYTVGDTSGWNQGVDYTTWASGKQFAVGDTLVFSYGGSHSVDVVSKSDYDSCTAGNALESHSDGSTRIPLTQAGSMYFVCPAFGHCGGGMKLAVTVSAASNSPGTASPTTPSTDTPSTDTPSTTNPSGTEPASTGSPPDSGVCGKAYNINSLVLGACIVFAPLFALMG